MGDGREHEMADDTEARQDLLGRIRSRRASINVFVRKVQSRSARLANLSIVSSALAGALVVSLVAAISTTMNKSQDSTARLSAAEACNTELEGLPAR
jgi:hypothetical protein